MITILFYLLKVVLCSALLYTYYWFVLRNKQFHQYNRFYLMGISVLSWIAPLIKIQIVKEQVIASPKVLRFANYISENNSLLEQGFLEKTAKYTWDNLLIIIGIIISLFFFVRFVKSLWDIRKLIRLYPLIELKGMNLVMTDVKGTPFSFFKYIFWNTAIDLNGDVGKKILSHEAVHIEENHSVDKLLIELQLLIGWFNPIVWLIRNELYLIHEFIADQKSIENQDSGVLAELLLASAYPKQQHLLTNTFFYSPIKRRLTMLTKSTNTKYSYLRRVMVLPILIATVFLVSIKVNASEKIEKTAKEIQNTIDLLVSDTTKPKKLTPPVPPTPPNPYKDKKVASTDQKRASAEQERASTAQEKASAEQERASTAQEKASADQKRASTAQEKASADQKRASTEQERASADQKRASTEQERSSVDSKVGKDANKLTFYLNGVKITEKEMKAISPNDIESINVLKGENAIKKYPEDGKDGVVEIKLKRKN
jgi:beta-lactamase regulating signal transducer with metallopeptidase domain